MIVHQSKLWINTHSIAFYDEENEYLHFIGGQKVKMAKKAYLEMVKAIADRKQISVIK